MYTVHAFSCPLHSKYLSDTSPCRLATSTCKPLTLSTSPWPRPFVSGSFREPKQTIGCASSRRLQKRAYAYWNTWDAHHFWRAYSTYASTNPLTSSILLFVLYPICVLYIYISHAIHKSLYFVVESLLNTLSVFTEGYPSRIYPRWW